MVSEEMTAVLTPPLALEGGIAAEHRAPNLIQRILSLFHNVRPGSDLTNFQLPPMFNLPKSHLQLFAEMIYCINDDYLSKCVEGSSSLERFTAVVAWNLSMIRPPIFGLAPYNPVLGETHHVSRGTLNILLEQVSHHPPVTALHATDEDKNIELIWCQHPTPKFHGTTVEATMDGRRQLKLARFDENYEMETPKLLIRILPIPGIEWVGNVRIKCKESGLEADLCFHKTNPFLGFGKNSRLVKGKIFYSNSLRTIYEIEGHWDRTVALKDVNSGESRVIYNAKEAIGKLTPPSIKDPKGLQPSESVVVWSEVSRSILDKDWGKAREAKRSIEEKQRELQRERKSKGEVWVPKHFILRHSKECGWDCSPIENVVHEAPIIAPCPEETRD
ncbi:Oxysterol-binding protein [Dioscorea alata]|uniref:Oxysterol-binding protein n=1 Tax=Dioscorea alata TaxID=55571 RepID=A0ACB7VKQ2_DIOAL|nr:Oxysterol-binding protein [Dioscorea alata]